MENIEFEEIQNETVNKEKNPISVSNEYDKDNEGQLSEQIIHATINEFSKY